MSRHPVSTTDDTKAAEEPGTTHDDPRAFGSFLALDIVRGARLFRGLRIAGGRYRMATDGCALYLQMICPSGTNPPASGFAHADDGSKIRCA